MGHIERTLDQVRGMLGRRSERSPRLPQLERYTGKVALIGGEVMGGSDVAIQKVHARQVAHMIGGIAQRSSTNIIRVQAFVPETHDPAVPSMAERSAQQLASALDERNDGLSVDYIPDPALFEMGPRHVQNGSQTLEDALTDFKKADEAQGGSQMLVVTANSEAAGMAFEHVHVPSLQSGNILMLQTPRDNPAKNLWVPAA